MQRKYLPNTCKPSFFERKFRYSLPLLREKSHITRKGVNLLGISDAAEAIGFRTMGVKVTFDKLKKTALSAKKY